MEIQNEDLETALQTKLLSFSLFYLFNQVNLKKKH